VIRLLIADDHPVVRHGLSQILARHPDLVVAAEVGDGRAVLDALRRDEFDVLVLDIAMPGMNGLEVLTYVRREHPGLPVIILSVHPEDQYGARVLRLGASGYLTKSGAPHELVAAIRKAASGGTYVSPALGEKLARNLAGGARPNAAETLSAREHDVMLKIAAGMRGKQIATELRVSPKTVSTYRTRILKKLGLRTTADLVRFALSQDLID
jgi:two-component system invasion response regulator UvrY